MSNGKVSTVVNTVNNERSTGVVKLASKSKVTNAGEFNSDKVLPSKITRRRHVSVNNTPDKYELDLQFRPRHREQIASAYNCETFKLWNTQNQDKFGFIPLGDLIMPAIDLQKHSQETIFDIHRRINVLTPL